MTNEEAKEFLDNLKICISEHPIVADWLVEIVDRKTEPTGYNLLPVDKDINVRSNSSEKPNNCEHITEDGVTCASYPACDDCPDNPLNKVKGSENSLKGKDEPQKKEVEWVYNKREKLWYPYSNGELLFKDEPQTERSE